MKAISQKLTADYKDKLKTFCLELRQDGLSDNQIGFVLRRHQDCKTKNFYNSKKIKINHISKCIDIEKKDSTAEAVFYNRLMSEKIPFQFQYKIGPYRVDFLIGDSLVFEGDGPQHTRAVEYDKNRDAFLKKSGFDVLRLRWEIVAAMYDQTINEIKKYLTERG